MEAFYAFGGLSLIGSFALLLVCSKHAVNGGVLETVASFGNVLLLNWFCKCLWLRV